MATARRSLEEADELVQAANRTIRKVDGHHWLLIAASIYEQEGLKVTAEFARKLAAERLAKGTHRERVTQ